MEQYKDTDSLLNEAAPQVEQARNMFRLVHRFPRSNKDDTFSFGYLADELMSDNYYNNQEFSSVPRGYYYKECQIAILDTINNLHSVDTVGVDTNSNMTVLKVLHTNNKGIYFKKRLESGYGGKTTRQYLTQAETDLLYVFIEQVNTVILKDRLFTLDKEEI